ncbi:hypothetical protein FFJ24_010320 [Pedobacter sp. KBS0701]|uniref:hypothetical protein n=1 Tax=Pedobacter sp. KBS0701 TaxID=2578106 RepID=UPI00110D3CDC|nr:hypothetical protein [Pedobacter sp. KBS0701]QDW25177.1 hypothetical protein FFJ24_010290 [Pedobacter sp. KBS0701]QDW25183.1 hypothetical protein FFJ24_010320 [Pedobacter sp. KBS0701]
MKLTPFFKVVPFFVLCALGTLVLAQPKIPVSPEAAALAKMVNYPVNFNTGVPDISVPLYTLQAGGLSLPITLSYHAGGFKTNERATRSGLGWSLSADIQITRTVNGTDDLAPGGYIYNEDIGYYNPSCPECNTSPMNVGSAYRLAIGESDGMPDKFNYQLLNKSGSFYFIKNENGTGYGIVPVPFEYLKISYSAGEFTIVDTDGTTYYFGGKGVLSTDNYAQKFTELTDAIRTGFKCSRIVNANRTEELNFVYQAKTPVNYFGGQQSIQYTNNPNPCELLESYSSYATHSWVQAHYPGLSDYDQLMSNVPGYGLSSPRYLENFGNGQLVFHLPDVNGTTAQDHVYTSNNGGAGVKINRGLALTQINFRTGSVVLNGTDALNSIQVKNASGEEVKTINFYQTKQYPTSSSVFSSYQEFLNNGTRYLDSVEFVAGGKRFDTYKFQYINKYCFGDHLLGKDVWGYPNVFTSNWSSTNVMAIRKTDIVQRYYRSLQYSCADYVDNVVFSIGSTQGNVESTDETPLYAGMLRRVVYPTGGYLDFEYEANSTRIAPATDNADLVAMTGGLRIKTISQYDGISNKPASYKYYRYGELEEGTGLLINNPYQEYDATNRSFKPYHYKQKTAYVVNASQSCVQPECMSIPGIEDMTTYIPSSSLDYTYPNGAPIYYTKVTEYNQDFGKMTGKKVYTFYQPNDFGGLGRFFNESRIPETNIDVLRTDGLMGQPSSIADYAYKNGSFSLAHLKAFTYYKFSRPMQIRVAYSFQKINFGAHSFLYQNRSGLSFQNGSYSLPDIFTAGQYSLPVAKLLPATEMERWYSGENDYVQTTTAYEYGNTTYPQPTKIITTGKNNGTVSKVLKYAYNFTGDAVCDTMKNRNMIAQPIEEISYSRSDNNGTDVETARTKTVYAALNLGWHILPSAVLKSVGGAPLETVMTFDQYGSHENVLQLTEKNSVVKSYLWDSQEVYPIVEVKGANYSDASAASGSAGYAVNAASASAIKSLGSTIQSALPNSMVSTYAYKPMVGVTVLTGPDERSKYFSYDDYGRLLTIRDHQQHILKKHEYILAKTPVLANHYFTYNNPMMLTFNAFGSDNIRRMVSARQSALRYTNPTSSLTANGGAENELNDVWYSIAGGVVDLSRPEANVKLRLNTWPSGGPIPTAVYLDLIRDGNIMVSKRIPYRTPTSSFEELYVEPGTYQVSIRYETNYNGSLCRLTIGNNAVRTGDTLNLQAGSTYDCILFSN